MKFSATKKILKYMIKDSNTTFDFTNIDSYNSYYLEKSKKEELLYARTKNLLQDRLQFTAIDIFDVTSHNYFIDSNGSRQYVREYMIGFDKNRHLVIKALDRINTYDSALDDISMINNQKIYRDTFKQYIWFIQSYVLGKSHINLVLCKKNSFWNGIDPKQIQTKYIDQQKTMLNNDFLDMYVNKFESSQQLKEFRAETHQNGLNKAYLTKLLAAPNKTPDDLKEIQELKTSILQFEKKVEQIKREQNNFKSKYEIDESQTPKYWEDSLLFDFEILDTHLTYNNFYDLIGWDQVNDIDRTHYILSSEDDNGLPVSYKKKRFTYIEDGLEKDIKNDLPMLGLDYYEMLANCCDSLNMKIPNNQEKADSYIRVTRQNDTTNAIRQRLTNDIFDLGFRLPFEIEWEFAAYGGMQRGTDSLCRWSGTNDFEETSKYMNYTNREIWQNESKLLSVRSKKANPFGIYDMSGNAYDPCMDSFIAYNDRNFKIVDPGDDSTRISIKDLLNKYEPILTPTQFKDFKDLFIGMLKDRMLERNSNYKYSRREKMNNILQDLTSKYYMNSQNISDLQKIKKMKNDIIDSIYSVDESIRHLIVKGGSYRTKDLKRLMISHRDSVVLSSSEEARDEFSSSVDMDLVGLRPCRFSKEKKYTYFDIVNSF